MMRDENKTRGLRAGFTPLGMWAFSIGTSIGWGSFIVTCNTYLQKSGVLGTVFGLLLGMAVILVITWNLQYMITRAPSAGGIYTFEKKVGGKDLGFIAMWFVLLTYLAILWANMTSLPLFARFFLGNAFRFGFHYQIFGYEVWLGEALLSMCAIVLIGFFCAAGTKAPNRVMIIAALTFTLGFTVCAVIAILRHESGFSYEPLYTEGSGAFAQIVRIAAISPWAFIGFENISHFSEEYRFPVKKVKGILVGSVLVTTLLYLFVSLLSVSAYPAEYDSWLSYIRDMGNLEGIKAVPAFYAADRYLGRFGVTVLMLALFGVILTSLIGNLLALSRLLFAAGREGEMPRAFAELNGKGVPGTAIWIIVAVSVFLPFLGRTAIGWIVDVTTLGATIIYGLISQAVFRDAQKEHRGLEKVTGILGVLLMVVFALLLLIPGLLPFDAMETESYVLFIVWSLLGLAYFRGLIRRDEHREYGKSMFVWILLLVLVLFASMMWVSRATENAAYEAVDNIITYHESHPADDSDAAVKAERQAFLAEQAEAITKTNMLYSVVSLGLFLLVVTMMLNNYRDTQALGERLSEAEHEAEHARKIAELKETIASLMDNIPGMTFSKDAETGVYLACNQAFANYAHKDTPEGVIGLKDHEIFDQETADHFVKDDQIALSMDRPYIFFEDVPDASGKKNRQLQTTKLKYIDAQGRQCVLGICQDVTNMVSIQHEEVMSAEDYENAVSSGLMYTHIAKTLAKDYTDMFYVNLDTEEYVEYLRGGEGSSFSEMRRGWHFFSDCRQELGERVDPEDREAFLRAMERRTLMKALERKESFVMTFRVLGENGSTYVSMKATRMEDDERFIIVGITDVDAEMRDAMAKSEALTEALNAAEDANKAKTSFLSSMSHEIRTPMNAIIGLDSLALRDETISEKTRDYLEKIYASAKHLLGLINDILDMSRIESGRLVLRREPFSLSTMLEQINTMVVSQCSDKGLSYECRVLSKLDDRYIGDDMKLKEVLINILSNAIKFTEAPGSVTLTVERTALFADQSTLRFCVRDTGIGMDEEYIPKIFDAFTQEDSSRTTKYGSTGLGMAITKRIVEMMNGSISVESEKGVGTEFAVTVTLRNGDQAAGPESTIDTQALNVLVVDDDRIAAEHAQSVLDEVGIRADVCTSGEEALRMMDVAHQKQKPYNLVLMDWIMPGMNGLETSAEISKQFGGESTVVVLTAYNWDDIHDEAERVGVDNFLTKPLFADKVVEAFERIARKNNMDLFKEKKRADLDGRKILLAEDMEINAEILTDILEMENIRVDHAENGRIAVEMFEKSAAGDYAAILMDVRMPEMDGLEATAAIRRMDREDARHVPIIALTANAFDEDVQRSLQAGMNAHLSKPVEAERLIQVLGELVYESES